MKKLSNKEIHDLFREVIPNKSNWFYPLSNLNLIKLDGTFCSDELREIARVLDEVNHGTPDDKKIDSR